MNRKEAAELLPILKAFSEGKEIEAVYKGTKAPWFEVEEMFFDKRTIFRIKPESKYRPFKDAAECWCEMLKHEPFGWVIRNDYHVNIANLIRQSITFADNEGRNSSFNELLEDCKFADGAKFGIKEV